MLLPLSAFALPEHASQSALAGSAVIVIDLLRASTTIASALANGATEIIPVQTPEQAFAVRKSSDLLGGERHGVRIQGFDLANSPLEYTRSRMTLRRLVFTTTNGTRAIFHAQAAGASLITIGSLANLSALSLYLSSIDLPINILCAGTGGKVSMEDCLAAGAFIERLTNNPARSRHTIEADDQSLIMLKLWRNESTGHGRLFDAVSSSAGGRNLLALGLKLDIRECIRIDSHAVVPIFNPLTKSITTH